MDSSVFESYQQDLETLITSISEKLTKDVQSQRGDARKATFRRLENELEESDEIIAQMEIEAQTADASRKASFLKSLKESKSTLVRQKAELKTLISSADRDDLLSVDSPHVALDMENEGELSDRAASPSMAQAQAQRAKLLSTTDKLTDGQRRLEDSHRIALEAETLGASILSDLRGQRDQIEHTMENLFVADGSIDRASNTLKTMVSRMYQQRAVTYAIIAILIFLIGYVLFSKLF